MIKDITSSCKYVSNSPDIVDADDEKLVVFIQSGQELHEIFALPFEFVFATLRHDGGLMRGVTCEKDLSFNKVFLRA